MTHGGNGYKVVSCRNLLKREFSSALEAVVLTSTESFVCNEIVAASNVCFESRLPVPAIREASWPFAWKLKEDDCQQKKRKNLFHLNFSLVLVLVGYNSKSEYFVMQDYKCFVGSGKKSDYW